MMRTGFTLGAQPSLVICTSDHLLEPTLLQKYLDVRINERCINLSLFCCFKL